MKDTGNVVVAVVVVVQERHWKCAGRKDNGNVVVVEEERQWEFGGFDR